MLLGIHLTLLIGPTVAVPAPPLLLEALEGIEITHSDQGRSGFQLTFQAGRSGPAGLFDYPLLSLPLLTPNNRVIVIVTFDVMPRVLMDGIITHQQLSPGSEPGSGTLTVTGEDVSVMMDREEKNVEHPAQDETIIALKIIASYAQYGLIPMVIPPLVIDPPIPIERIPVQRATDLAYLKQMADRFGYVFYISPGPAPFTNLAYWGPPVRAGLPQRALSLNVGPETNVSRISFQNDSNAPTLVSGEVQDRQTGQTMPVQTFLSTRLPPLAALPAILVNQPNVRSTRFDSAGLNTMQAFARAQGITDASTDNVAHCHRRAGCRTLWGSVHTRGLVGLRGAGYSYDGLYYVKNVTHSIRRGEYKQRFTITREGLGSTTPVVIP